MEHWHISSLAHAIEHPDEEESRVEVSSRVLEGKQCPSDADWSRVRHTLSCKNPRQDERETCSLTQRQRRTGTAAPSDCFDYVIDLRPRKNFDIDSAPCAIHNDSTHGMAPVSSQPRIGVYASFVA